MADRRDNRAERLKAALRANLRKRKAQGTSGAADDPRPNAGSASDATPGADKAG